jgi:hypothetical protein
LWGKERTGGPGGPSGSSWKPTPVSGLFPTLSFPFLKFIFLTWISDRSRSSAYTISCIILYAFFLFPHVKNNLHVSE